MLSLIADLNRLPAAAPLHSPLPVTPAAPISYLSALRDKVAVPHETSRNEQELVLAEFRRRISVGEDKEELEILLKRFRRRDDLNVYVAEGVDNLLLSLEPSPAGAGTSSDDAPDERHVSQRAAEPSRAATTVDTLVFGPIAMFLAHRAGKGGNPNGQRALWIAIAATVVGLLLGALMLAA